MKKYLPLIVLLAGIVVVVVAIVAVRKKFTKGNKVVQEETFKEVPFVQRPFTSLTPSSDGHWLTLEIGKIIIEKAASMDYELLYSLPDGRTQGVPGTVPLDGEGRIERELLLGSESSGKFRYDEGVTEGTLALRFRNSNGKLLSKFMTKWHLQTGQPELTALDGDLSYRLAKASDGYFVTMQTFGLPAGNDLGGVLAGPYGIFSSLPSLPEGSAPPVWEKTGGNVFYKKQN